MNGFSFLKFLKNGFPIACLFNKCSTWELEVWESRTSYQNTLVRCIKCNRILSQIR